MGLLFSAIISYAGVLEALECINHILAGMVPNTEPDFRDLAEYYTRLLKKTANPSSVTEDWTRSGGQGYLCLSDNEDGSVKSAVVKYYNGSKPDSTAILFSTKISSFGQDFVDSYSSQANGDYGNKKTDRYTTTTTKTIISKTSESFNVGQRDRSTTPSYDNISDPIRFSEDSFEHNPDRQQSVELTQEDKRSVREGSDSRDKLKWHYRPLSPVPQTLPEIHFQPIDGTEKSGPAYSEDFLRSLDGIKYRPMQRSDPSGRRRSFKKRHSSSSTSSKDSRASREEELKIFTSLEEAEFERMNTNENISGFGSTPNLAARSYSRSRSRENSKERRNESWSMEGSVEIEAEADIGPESKPRLKDLPVLGSFEEEHVEDATDNKNEVMDDEEEEIDDFWGNSGD